VAPAAAIGKPPSDEQELAPSTGHRYGAVHDVDFRHDTHASGERTRLPRPVTV
jgi:hypothetical protein